MLDELHFHFRRALDVRHRPCTGRNSLAVRREPTANTSTRTVSGSTGALHSVERRLGVLRHQAGHDFGQTLDELLRVPVNRCVNVSRWSPGRLRIRLLRQPFILGIESQRLVFSYVVRNVKACANLLGRARVQDCAEFLARQVEQPFDAKEIRGDQQLPAARRRA